jgi:hypothetical protein
MSSRISANLSPLQSPSSAILSSIRRDALTGSDESATALRALAAFAPDRLVAVFATFAGLSADFFLVFLFAVFSFAAAFFVDLPAIVFTPGDYDGSWINGDAQALWVPGRLGERSCPLSPDPSLRG